MKPKVFIAHAREDEREAEQLYRFLEKKGCEPWLDVIRLSPGAPWKNAIRRAIRGSDFFVACLSTASVSKIGYFQAELREAYDFLQEYPDENIFLMPARLDDCLVPFTLRDRQWVDLFVPGGEQKLVDAIHCEWSIRRSMFGRDLAGANNHRPTPLAEVDRCGLLLKELRQAIETNQLTLYYQPKVQLTTKCVVGVESLLRWDHPRRGILLPGQFLPMAEASSLIDDITLWALDHALEQCSIWDRAGLEIPVGVNVSARNLHLRTLPELVAGTLQRWKVPASSLQLEITETAVVEDMAVARKVLAELQGIGVSVAIDDFGTGQSSLQKLNLLTLDELKLDRPLIEGIEDSERQQSMVQALVQMGHSLGLRVIAEGVESKASYGVLTLLECDEVQGYFLSRPLPPRELVRWLVDSPWKLAQTGAISADEVQRRSLSAGSGKPSRPRGWSAA